jgi:hypothetical protein
MSIRSAHLLCKHLDLFMQFLLFHLDTFGTSQAQEETAQKELLYLLRIWRSSPRISFRSSRCHFLQDSCGVTFGPKLKKDMLGPLEYTERLLQLQG